MQHAPWLTPKKTPPFASFAPGSACAVPPRARAHLPAEVIAHDRPVPHRLEGAAVERAHARAPRLGGRRRRERRRRHRSSPAARCRLPAEREKGGELLTRGRRPHSAGRRARRAPRTARQRAELCAAAPCVCVARLASPRLARQPGSRQASAGRRSRAPCDASAPVESRGENSPSAERGDRPARLQPAGSAQTPTGAAWRLRRGAALPQNPSRILKSLGLGRVYSLKKVPVP